MRLRKESKLKGVHHQTSPSVPKVPWLILQSSNASDGRSGMSQSQNERLMELRENKRTPKPSIRERSPSFSLFDKALGSQSTSKKEWKQEIKKNLTSEHFEQLQKLQREFPRLDVGRLLGIKIKAQRGAKDFSEAGSPDNTAVSKVQSLLKLLDELGCPSNKALEFVSKELDTLIQGGRTSLNNSHRVGECPFDLFICSIDFDWSSASQVKSWRGSLLSWEVCQWRRVSLLLHFNLQCSTGGLRLSSPMYCRSRRS